VGKKRGGAEEERKTNNPFLSRRANYRVDAGGKRQISPANDKKRGKKAKKKITFLGKGKRVIRDGSSTE